MRRAAPVLFALALMASTLPLAPASAAPTLPATVELPGWAVGFHWTYHYEGNTDQTFAGFRATYMNDTYTSELIGENDTARGRAFVLRNAHAGTLSGEFGGFPVTGTFTSLSFYYIRESDLAVLNYTQDLEIFANAPPPFGAINGSAHNESIATPPLAQIAYGSPADGTPWHVYSNISSTGWYRFGPSPQVNISSYLVLDYNLSVASTANVVVPAGTFASYNITGGGTADFNGSVYNFTESFFLAPSVMEKSIDEAGYLLQSFYVNHPPAPAGLPPLPVTAGGSADIALPSYFLDAEGDSFTFNCTDAPPLHCSVAGNGTLTVSADPGVNATLLLPIGVDDGLPGGNATYFLTVLVTGPGNPNQPPVLVGGTTLTTTEDIPYTFLITSHYNDPDDAQLNYSFTLGPDLVVTATSATYFRLATPTNFTGNTTFSVDVFDTGGNYLSTVFTLAVIASNDPPEILPFGALDLVAHEGDSVTVVVDLYDADGDAVTAAWRLDGTLVGSAVSLDLNLTSISVGNHTLVITATDSHGANSSLTYNLRILSGPSIVDAHPQTPLTVALGSRVAFSVTASDPDSPVLDYAWSLNGSVFAQGTASDAVNVSFPAVGTFTLTAQVSDGNTTAAHQWIVTVEAAPPNLVTISSPTPRAEFEANASVNVTASVDPRLTNLTLEWTLNSTALPSSVQVSTPPLAPGNYTVTLHVSGLYNGSIPYSDVLHVDFHVNAPQPPVVTPPNNHGTAKPPPPAESSLWLLILIAVAAAGAASVVYMKRRGKAAPPA